MEPTKYVSRPTEVLASEPLTPDNREAIWKWIATNGGWAVVLPDGYEKGLVLRTVSGAEIDVVYGERVLWNPAAAKVDFWPIAPEQFEAKYEVAS